MAAEKEVDPSLTAADLLRIANDALDQALGFVRATPASQAGEERMVGRKKLHSNVRGLLYEIATHTSRHIGQIATTARILR